MAIESDVKGCERYKDEKHQLSIDSDQAMLVQTGHDPRDDLANGADSSGQLLFRDGQIEFNGVALLAACLCLSTSAAHFRKRRDKTRNAERRERAVSMHRSSGGHNYFRPRLPEAAVRDRSNPGADDAIRT